MITKRTDGSGASHNDLRLKLLSKCLDYVQVKGIYQLNDHKGILTVVWENKFLNKHDCEKVKLFWEAFCEYEIEHTVITTEGIYNDLYNELSSKYEGCCDRDLETNKIEVDCSSGLFDYDKYTFDSIDIKDMELSKIVKKFSDNFYCEWKDYNTQIISIDYDNIK